MGGVVAQGFDLGQAQARGNSTIFIANYIYSPGAKRRFVSDFYSNGIVSRKFTTFVVNFINFDQKCIDQLLWVGLPGWLCLPGGFKRH